VSLVNAESQNLILLEDISQIVMSSHNLRETLDHITALIAEKMGVEVCSVYLMEEGQLVLFSTKGLKPSAVGTVRMIPGEGLTGLTFQEARPVNVEYVEDHPRNKFFPNIGEESFHSYLGVPLMNRGKTMGVLTVQTKEHRSFTSDDVRLLVTTAGQLSSTIAYAHLLDRQAKKTEVPPPSEVFFRGIAVSGGVARGVGYPLLANFGLEIHEQEPVKMPAEELENYERALSRSMTDIEGLRHQVVHALSKEDGSIFHAHLMILQDRNMQEKVRSKISAGWSAIRAVSTVARNYTDAFLALEDPYIRERAADIRDVAQRLIKHLQEEHPPSDGPEFKEPTVVIAQDLTPSEFVQMLQPNLVGVVLAKGGRNSHTAILCRSSGIPAVVGLDTDLPHLTSGQPVILDGNAGLLYLSPSEQVIQEYQRLTEDAGRLNAELRSHIQESARTRDGLSIRLMGNAALLSDIPRILEGGGEGVGLYRTEFPFLIRSDFPDEEAQVEIYGKILSALDGRPATLRTLDIGGDKNLPYLQIPKEDNPHLGWRSIRVSLEMQDPFRIQLRALLRASLQGPLRIMFPMISTVEELRQCREILEEETRRLVERGIEVRPVSVGAMIEVPSAALAIDRLSPLVDFFSIGTNDLIQYLLAVDRANRKVAHLYEPLHPTVLDVVSGVVSSARSLGRTVSVCGEMASRTLGAAALIAVGVEELSVSPGALLRVRRLIQTVDANRLRALAPQLRTATGAFAVRTLLEEELVTQEVQPSLWSGE
jgi:phosphotransferase system enzyme I (PtsP)